MLLLLRPCSSRAAGQTGLAFANLCQQTQTSRPRVAYFSAQKNKPESSVFHPDNKDHALYKNTLTVFPAVTRLAKVYEKKSFIDNVMSFLPGKMITESESKVNTVAMKVYVQCSAGIDYVQFIKAYHMPDIFDSWLRMTILHMWFVFIRAREGLDESTYIRLRDSMIVVLWDDVKKRLETLSKQWKRRLTTVQNYELFDLMYITIMTNMDEGLLGDDKALAAALWCCLYDNTHVDPVRLVELVKYTRHEIHQLDQMTIDEIMVRGIPTWK